jgi:hypothetical protein
MSITRVLSKTEALQDRKYSPSVLLLLSGAVLSRGRLENVDEVLAELQLVSTKKNVDDV